MSLRILTTRVSGMNLVTLRDRTRQVGQLFGLDKLQCTRFITAVSEIARNTVQYAGEGTVTFVFESAENGSNGGQHLTAQVADKGPGIKDLAAVLAGRLNQRGEQPLGIAGSRRLVDELVVQCPPEGGTLVALSMALPKTMARLSGADVASRVDQLARRKPQSPMEELEQQNREMLFALEELRLKQQELQVADLRKNQFLSTLAHELRGPLGTLHMTLEVLKRKTDIDAAELAKRCEVMGRQTSQLANLVNDLMDVTRVTLGKVELEKKSVEVNELVSQAVEMSEGAIRAKEHAVAVALHDGPLWIHGDTTRLKQVLCNLLQNAARYTPERGTIDVSVRREAAYAVVKVADSGIGIPADILPHVFDLFVQGAPGGTSGNQGGLGVGLTLVRKLTEDHAGTVSAASAGTGLGSQFTVTLPLASAPA
jgi:signal transduction histidine kinase